MGTYRGFITDNMRKALDSGDFLLSIVMTSYTLESLLFWKLFFEKGIPTSLMDNWTLGRLIDWNLKLNLVDEKNSILLKDFKKLRNCCAHDYGYVTLLSHNKLLLERVNKVVLETLNFIDLEKIKYPDASNEKDFQKMEQEYAKYHEKMTEKQFK